MKLPSHIRAKLSALNSWKTVDGSDSGLDLITYATFVATPDLMLSFADLFDPEILNYEGHSFLAARFDERVCKKWLEQGTSYKQVQIIMNQIKMRLLLQNAHYDHETIEFLANVLANIWRKTLRSNDIIIEVMGSDVEDLVVTFFDRDAR